MFFPDEMTNGRNNDKSSDEFIEHILSPISSIILDRNIKHNGNKVTEIAPDACVKDLIAKPSEMLCAVEQHAVQPEVVNYIQTKKVIIISILDSTELKKDLFHAASPENECNLKKYQLLQYTEMVCQSKQRLPLQAITKGPKLENQENDQQISTNISELDSILDNVTHKTTNTYNDKIRTKNSKLHYDTCKNLLKPTSSEYQIARDFYIYNKLFKEFLKTFALMFCTLSNKLLTRHKNAVALCSHYWHFRNLTQGYVLKCLLNNGKVNVLNFITNLYFIIITNCNSATTIDIFFKLRDGIFIVSSENQECRFTQQILLNKDTIDDLDNMSTLRDVNDNELPNTESKNDKNNSACSKTSSACSLPIYPSQSMLLEAKINTRRHYTYDEPENETPRISSNRSFKNSDLQHDLNEMFVNIRCGIQDLGESLCDLSRCTNQIVYNQYCCAASILIGFDIFNEHLFEFTSFDNFLLNVKEVNSIQFSWQKIGKPLLQALGKYFAYTLFSSVL